MTSPMTPEELSALADQIAGISRGKARLYFLVPKRQPLPPLSELELEPGSVRFLGAQAPAGGRLVAELSEVSGREVSLLCGRGSGRFPGQPGAHCGVARPAPHHWLRCGGFEVL